MTGAEIHSGHSPQNASSSRAIMLSPPPTSPGPLLDSPPPASTTSIHSSLPSSQIPDAEVLELGCGAGVPCTQALVKHGLNVTAADISSAQIELAHEHVPHATLIHADMMSPSFEPNSFDAVVVYSNFHLPQEQGMMIGRIQGWLKDKGCLLSNLSTDEGELGVDGNRNMLMKDGVWLRVVDDEVAVKSGGKVPFDFGC